MKFHIVMLDPSTGDILRDAYASDAEEALRFIDAVRIQENDSARTIQTSEEILALLGIAGQPTNPTTNPTTNKTETTMAKKTKFRIAGSISEEFEIVIEAIDESQARNSLDNMTVEDMRAHAAYEQVGVDLTVKNVTKEEREFYVEGTIVVPFNITVTAVDEESAKDMVDEMTFSEIKRIGEVHDESVSATSAEPVE